MVDSNRELISNSGFWKLQGTRQRLRPSARTWRFILLVGDGILLLALLTMVLLLAPVLQIKAIGFAPEIGNGQFIWVCLALVSWSIAISITRVQEMTNVSSRLKSPLFTLFALALMLVFWVVFSYPFVIGHIVPTIKMVLIFFMLAAPTFSIWRVLLAEIIHLPRFLPQAVIVGMNSAGETIAQEMRNAKRPAANILGYISESSDESRKLEGLSILGGRSMLRHLIWNSMLDMIIMATDYKANPELFKDAIEATQFGVSVVPMPMIYERTTGKIPVEHVGDQWYLSLPMEHTSSLLYLCWRKAMDLAFGLLGSLALLLILPLLALLIRLDSPGPIFYTQERVGSHGKIFRILKFRSMRTDAERSGNAMWAAKGDKRVTRVGRFLRATHLDELPQVLNILRGDMSLVGPRPERQEFVQRLEKKIPFYRCRLRVKPGLTGWAQVKYPYGSSDTDAISKLQYDLYYIKHQSFTLDICIILKTVGEMLLCRGR